MSDLKGINHLKARFNFDKLTNWGILQQKDFNNTTEDKVNVRGKQRTGYANPLVRIREDKLRSMKRALYNSYQSAVIVFDKDQRNNGIGYRFRCLINHDKLKVDYQDKILSIPFKQVPVQLESSSLPIEEKMLDTGTYGIFLDQNGNPVLDQNNQQIYQYRVKPGDTFRWISGNQGYMPDSYWIIFLQYSQETAYFRGQIRKADDEIEIIPIDQDGQPGEPILYHGWTTGPNEDQAIWNVKRGVVWNDLYYTKILYITKDQTTEAFFKRFDRVVINDQTWQIQGYNSNYGTTSKNSTGGMIRVALKETYTSTNEVIQSLKEQYQTQDSVIIGPAKIQSYDVVTYQALNSVGDWSYSSSAPVTVLSQSNNKIKFEIEQVNSTVSFNLYHGNQVLQITVKPFK